MKRKRIIYVLVAMAAAALLEFLPILMFLSDKGILYHRSLTMNQHVVQLWQTPLQGGHASLVASSSVEGLWYCYLALLICCALCLLYLLVDENVLTVATITIAVAGVYYVLLMVYVLLIITKYDATFCPNVGFFLPGVVIQMMVLLRRNVAEELSASGENEEKEFEP